MFSVFVRQKVNANENISFMDYGPGIWVPGLRKTQLNMAFLYAGGDTDEYGDIQCIREHGNMQSIRSNQT